MIDTLEEFQKFVSSSDLETLICFATKHGIKVEFQPALSGITCLVDKYAGSGAVALEACRSALLDFYRFGPPWSIPLSEYTCPFCKGKLLETSFRFPNGLPTNGGTNTHQCGAVLSLRNDKGVFDEVDLRQNRFITLIARVIKIKLT